MKRVPLVLAALLAQPGGAFVQVPVPPCQARLELTQHDQLLTVAGHCRSTAPAPAHYRYQLLVTRQSRAGRSQNSQGGEFMLLPNQDLVLSQVRVSALAHDEYQAKLLIFDLQGQIVARDSAGQGTAMH
ncbi:hypothetical protein MON38_11820 [Hymenobacter sp. DH14]|uniref:Curli assembly protein CsgC n=1 Tax=Hymenobacter cyanobacteriorum TaxID=2926463 RepID=A0A9X2AFQ8_9BACT|nr:curli-like amyloid fiber formation chaperone CsgH [Hymenobacter cyanobacteriorum]MCI1188107.1 hypothetical protein [Hymenobacter cyanobacteriorum]